MEGDSEELVDDIDGAVAQLIRAGEYQYTSPDFGYAPPLFFRLNLSFLFHNYNLIYIFQSQ